MIINKILGNRHDFDLKNKNIDTVNIEWYEVNKKILRKTSKLGKEIGMSFEKPQKLNDGDVLYMNEKEAILINIPESEAIVIEPKSMIDMGKACYEIGNQHIPIFLEEDSIIVPYEEPIMKLLDKRGFAPKRVLKKLVNGLECHKHHHVH